MALEMVRTQLRRDGDGYALQLVFGDGNGGRDSLLIPIGDTVEAVIGDLREAADALQAQVPFEEPEPTPEPAEIEAEAAELFAATED